MKLIVISPPGSFPNEADHINALLDEGLKIFHLRKPDHSSSSMEKIISKIKTRHLGKISIHSHHEKANDWGISRLHFPEKMRMETTAGELKKTSTKKLSTSVHGEKWSVGNEFRYVFYGPVFESISKKGYGPEPGEEILLTENKVRGTKIFAIGGINEKNISRIQEMGFDGAALLGAIWNSKEPLTSFKKISNAIQHLQPANVEH
ncbi:MAG: thiamine phosphate synthase [Bacteroidetes bacterium]|nr:thiamine phosphate synthase [Bacteroidota bacterium]